MTCADIEILLADYVDGTLHGEQKFAVETHLAGCEGCAELARDAAGAVAFMDRAAEVDHHAKQDEHQGRDESKLQRRLARFGRGDFAAH